MAVAAADVRWMRLALSLGARGLGRTAENPAVGCVIVKDGRVLGRGRTADGGRPHAEVVALAQAGEAARGATAYVTLEPCNHTGQTGPCSEALTRAGVARVVAAIADPDPRTSGAGMARLEAAGVAVTLGCCEAAARRAHAGFFSRLSRGRPSLTLKLASSLDGRIATASGESQWITGPQARRLVHAMRARHDAVLVGAGTARADDPGLTVRDLGPVPQPARVVLSRRLDIPLDGQLAQSARDVPVILLHGPNPPEETRMAWEKAGAQLQEVPIGAGRQLDPEAALRALGAMGLNRVFCEGGGHLAAALLSHDLVDELAVFQAGLMIGAEGLPSLGAMGLAHLSEASRFELSDCRSIGPDSLSLWSRRELG